MLGPCESGEHLGGHGSRGEAKLAELRRGACEVLDGFIADIGKLVALRKETKGACVSAGEPFADGASLAVRIAPDSTKSFIKGRRKTLGPVTPIRGCPPP